MTRDTWLLRHSYLQPVADLHALVETVAAEIPFEEPCVPAWKVYADDFQQGVPLLKSPAVTIDFTAAEGVVALLVGELASGSRQHQVAEETRTLDSELRCNPDAPHKAVAWLLDEQDYVSSCPGLLRYLGWFALGRFLRPLMDSFAVWRDEERWLRSYCPTCGSRPSMAQLVGADPGRLRLLSCGRCKTRWRYRRIGCPFCENRNYDRLTVLLVEGEGGLRIDYCEGCRGYLKTYDGEGSEEVLLADWTSIHLDTVARDRGLIRSAASLYEVN